MLKIKRECLYVKPLSNGMIARFQQLLNLHSPNPKRQQKRERLVNSLKILSIRDILALDSKKTTLQKNFQEDAKTKATTVQRKGKMKGILQGFYCAPF